MAWWLQWPIGCTLDRPAYSFLCTHPYCHSNTLQRLFSDHVVHAFGKDPTPPLFCPFYPFQISLPSLQPFAHSASHISREFLIFFLIPGNRCGVVIAPLLSIHPSLPIIHFTHRTSSSPLRLPSTLVSGPLFHIHSKHCFCCICTLMCALLCK